MAYTTGTLSYLAGGPVEGSWKLWDYLTTDSLTTVTGSGYVTDATAKGMGVGDFVIVANQVNPQGYILQVQSMTAASGNTPGTATLAQPAGVGGSQLALPRNIIDGGDFTTNPWQRGTSFTSIASTLTYTADRWFAIGGASSSISVSQQAVTAVPTFGNALQFGRASGNANTAVITLGQVIESADSIRAHGQPVTLSFWAAAGANWSPANGNLNVQMVSGTGTNQSTASAMAGTWTGFSLLTVTPQQGPAAAAANQNAFTPAVRVSGVGPDRNYAWTISGSWSGTLTFQRSYTSATAGFVDVSTVSANGTINSSTGGSGGSPDLDNVIVWERVGFKGGNYTSGNATAISNYAGGGGYAICRVTGYLSPTLVNIEILQPFATLQATTDWVEGDWSNVVGFPSSVSFHEGRLGWFRGDQIWLSASDDFTSFADINSDGTPVGAAGTINVTLGSGPVDTISWGLSLTRLQLGREQSIASARSSNFDQAMTGTDIVIRDCSDQGAARLPAIKAGKRGIFVQQSGRRVFELFFNAQEFDYDDRDLTRLNLDIGVPGFVDIDKATQPDKMIFLPRGDGQCAALLYDVKDEVEAWWRLATLGVIENVAVLPQNGIEDLLYFVVRRTVNGVTRRFIERIAPRANCVGGAINQQLDCHVTYSGSPVASIQLAQLPNTTVSVWADGQSIGSGTTDGSGNLNLPDGLAHSNIVAGLAGVVVTSTATSATGTLTVGTQYNGYPAEVFADIGSTGEPVHIGSLMVPGCVKTRRLK